MKPSEEGQKIIDDFNPNLINDVADIIKKCISENYQEVFHTVMIYLTLIWCANSKGEVLIKDGELFRFVNKNFKYLSQVTNNYIQLARFTTETK